MGYRNGPNPPTLLRDEPKFLVSLDIIANAKGRKVLRGLDTHGLAIRTRETKNGLMWCMDSREPESARLESHVQYIVDTVRDRFPARSLKGIGSVYLEIGVLFYTFTGSVLLDVDSLRALWEIFPEIQIEVVYYPTES